MDNLLLLVPLDDTVVFPTMDVTLPVDVAGEERVLLVPRHDGEFAKVGTIASVSEVVRLPGGGRGASLEGGQGNDRLDGGSGNDTINGGFGTDTIDCGPGDDTLVSSGGGDSVVNCEKRIG